jgi:transcriptional regulator with XRE-family HTH domain
VTGKIGRQAGTRVRGAKTAGRSKDAPARAPQLDHYDAFHFGERLRAFRKARGWSLEHSADLVGVPASTLSRIENRKMSPTLDLIFKIVRAMNLHPYDVLGRDALGGAAAGVSVTRKGAGEYTELPNILYAPLHPGVSRGMVRPVLVSLFARTVEEYGGLTAHSGEEFLYVLQGTVAVHFAGLPTETLNEGDSIFFDSHIPHAYVSGGNSQSKILIVASTLDPPFDGPKA